MKTKLSIYSQLNYLTPQTAIEAKILFAVCISKKQALTGGKSLACEDKCSKKIGAVLVQQADRHSFEASAVFNFVFFVMLKNKIEQSAAQRYLRPFELRVLPFGKTSGIEVLNLLNSPIDRIFENRPMKNYSLVPFSSQSFAYAKLSRPKPPPSMAGERKKINRRRIGYTSSSFYVATQ
ncbi:hypothetical protein [Treponema pedis]|uniref:hypothetical protein n=1 Tax=Treponema pedis TaxID=409322 RepID=UPI00041502C4|nr:hypothetical protein [Treponema pedis]